MRLPSPLRTTASGVLSGMSVVLSAASQLARLGARQLTHDDESATPRRAPEEVDDLFAHAAPSPDVLGPASQRPAAPVDAEGLLGDDGHVRTFESHIAEVAERPAADVARAVADLSTEELGQLFDYESTHRKRKSVLAAIERAVAPTGEELVHTSESTETRPR